MGNVYHKSDIISESHHLYMTSIGNESGWDGGLRWYSPLVVLCGVLRGGVVVRRKKRGGGVVE